MGGKRTRPHASHCWTTTMWRRSAVEERPGVLVGHRRGRGSRAPELRRSLLREGGESLDRIVRGQAVVGVPFPFVAQPGRRRCRCRPRASSSRPWRSPSPAGSWSRSSPPARRPRRRAASSSTTRLTRPHSAASVASRNRPVNTQLAGPGPARSPAAAASSTPPPPIWPKLRWASPMRAERAARAKSQFRSSSRPPAAVTPFTRATTGTGKVRSRPKMRCSSATKRGNRTGSRWSV